MIEFIKIIALAIIQGVAEFLPISSSGHLAILGSMLEVDPANKMGIIVVLHAGTLLAIIMFYFYELIKIIKERNFKLVARLFIATVPIGIFGLFLHFTGFKDQLFNSLLFPGIGFFFTGAMLLYGMKERESDVIKTEIKDLTIKNSILIGLAQAFAILPGVSRSGSTISAALKLGIKKSDAATFSFLLAIPAISGASFVELISAFSSEGGIHIDAQLINSMAVGFLVSAIVGFFALKILLLSLKKGKLAIYAYYCFALGLSILIWESPVIYKFIAKNLG